MTPIILGTVAGQTVAAGQDIDPFSSTIVTDPNDYPGAEKTDVNTLTISLLDASGNPTDANGSLTLLANATDDTLSKTSPGVYVLTDPQDPDLTVGLFKALPDLEFIPATAATTTFQLTATDVYGESLSDSTTTVTAASAGSATPSPTPTTPTTTPPTTTPPPTLAELTLPSGGSLKDTVGNLWTLTAGGSVDENGKAVPGGGGTRALAIVNGAVYGEDNGGNGGGWFTYSTSTHFWTKSAAPT